MAMTVPSTLQTAAVLIIAFAIPALGGCGEPGKPVGAVSEAEFTAQGLTWPLTVSSAVVGCDPVDRLWVKVDGVRYGLNGLASRQLGYSDLRPLRRMNEQQMSEMQKMFPGEASSVTYLEPQRLMDAARALCR
jgi:hypothetical protein